MSGPMISMQEVFEWVEKRAIELRREEIIRVITEAHADVLQDVPEAVYEALQKGGYLKWL